MRDFRQILAENLHQELMKARSETDTNPTDAQKEASNYKKGRVTILGFNIAIENPKGTYRKGKDSNGKEWKTLMRNDYGYFTRTLGKDGDAIDVFIGPNLESEKIFPIDQYINGKFDETKVMLGFSTAEEAKRAYLSNYDKDWKGFKYITEVGVESFKKWLYDGARQRKPFAKYKSLNEEQNKYAKWLKRLKKRRDPANIENWEKLNEGKKVVKNDEGKVVPEKCDKCGSEVGLYIQGEPIYKCSKCGKYFGTMPFPENLNESFDDLFYDITEEYSPSDLLYEFLDDKKNGIPQKRWNLIPAEQYHTLLKRYMESPEMARIPASVVNHWFKDIVAPNAITVEYMTEFAGHSGYFPGECIGQVLGAGENDYIGYDEGWKILDEEGFYDWCKLPDGSDAWSDYGLNPIFALMKKFNENADPAETLILINRILDIGHQRGDLASAFIEGGSKSCDYISNSLNEGLSELSPKLLQRAYDKAEQSRRYNQRDAFDAGAAARMPEFNIEGRMDANPRRIRWINGIASCLIAKNGQYHVGSANYFKTITSETGTFSNSSDYIPEYMKSEDKVIARKIAKWWQEYGEVDIPKLGDWHSFVNL